MLNPVKEQEEGFWAKKRDVKQQDIGITTAGFI
jgi:hypothetical protein